MIDIKQLKADFDRDGFAIVREFHTQEQTHELLEHAEQAIATLQSPRQYNNVNKGLERLDPYFHKLLHEGKHLPILTQLLGETPNPSTSSYFTKTHLDEEIYPHSDGDNGGTVWISLDESTLDNGCLHFLKGSHLQHERLSHLHFSQENDVGDDPNAVAAIMNPGDTVFFSAKTKHWSGPNRSGKPRRGVNCFYIKWRGHT
ncbi:MAG: phytanoyl-CoA dioxygenase family protein [Pseudomonadota bacterium]